MNSQISIAWFYDPGKVFPVHQLGLGIHFQHPDVADSRPGGAAVPDTALGARPDGFGNDDHRAGGISVLVGGFAGAFAAGKALHPVQAIDGQVELVPVVELQQQEVLVEAGYGETDQPPILTLVQPCDPPADHKV